MKRTGPRRVLIVSPMNVGSLGFFCRRAFERLGYTVEVFDYRREALGENYDRTVRAGLARILRNKVRVALMNRRLGKVVEREAPDLILVIKGELIAPGTVERISRAGGSAIVLWYPDASRYLAKRAFWRIVAGMAYYHVTFLCDPENVPEHLRAGIRRAEFLTFACDPEFHRPLPLSPEDRARYGSRISFVGNSHGPGSLRDSTLLSLGNYPLTVWGAGWERSPLARDGVTRLAGPAYGEEMLKVYNASEITLNFSLERYLIFRNFEAPACGPLLVTEDLPKLEQFFRPGDEVVTFRDTDDLRQKLDYYLTHPTKRAAVAARGQRRTHKEHTFVCRMEELVRQVFGS